MQDDDTGAASGRAVSYSTEVPSPVCRKFLDVRTNLTHFIQRVRTRCRGLSGLGS